MTSEQIKTAIEKYTPIIIDKPFSTDMKDHKISGFAVKPKALNDYELFVIGENLNHNVPFIDAPLESWLTNNGYQILN